MQPSLQEIGIAALQDIEVRDAKRRRRRAALSAKGARRPILAKTARVDLPLAAAFQSWEQAAIRNRSPVTVPVPHKRYLALGAAGLVLIIACSFGFVWARESMAWRSDAQSRRHAAILLQGTALHGQIETFTRQAQRLDEKARSLIQYASDLRYSYPSIDGSPEIQQADAVLADRDRLLAEIENRRERLKELSQNIAALSRR